MNKSYIIRNTQIITDSTTVFGDIHVADGLIQQIGANIKVDEKVTEINGENQLTIPGIIDDQVHFREPGLTHKAEIYTEAKAAVAGGITSFMEMPNVVPQTLTQELLSAKYDLGAKRSLANYSFYMGASNDNLEEVLKTDGRNVCGVKVFMGSSTGDMLVDDQTVLEGIFSKVPLLIATHCEDEATIRRNTALAREQFGDVIPFAQHPVIRSEEACYLSSSRAVGLAKKYNTRLHVLHISTGKETALFGNTLPLGQKRITSEACIHHLWFTNSDYEEKGAFIKWNPAVKTSTDRSQIWQALKNDQIDVIATDHAPHTLQEKSNTYLHAPSGGPLVQHALPAMLEFVKKGEISYEWLVEKMCHAPAACFDLEKRGYIREGYYADLVMIDPNQTWTVGRGNVLSKCGWSPFEDVTFSSTVKRTFVSGHLAYNDGQFDESRMGHRLTFSRDH